MKDYILPLASLCVGASVLLKCVCGKSMIPHVKALATLLLMLSVTASFGFSLDVSDIEFETSVIEESDVYDAVSDNVERFYNEYIRNIVTENFPVKRVEVETSVVLNESASEIGEINIFVEGNVPLERILRFVEAEVGTFGRVSVKRMGSIVCEE